MYMACNVGRMAPSTTQGMKVIARPERIVVQVTADEKRKFERRAKERNTNLSEYIRQTAHDEADNAELKKKGRAA